MHDHDIFGGGDWRVRLDQIVQTMRDISETTDPDEMVRIYRGRLAEASKVDGFLSVSRRGVEPPGYRIARSSLWERQQNSPNPWTERDRLPVLEGGLLGELMDSQEPRIIDDLKVAADDPAAEFFQDMRSLAAIPVFDRGEVKNLVVQMRRQPESFDPDRFPQMVWMTNLFSRATHILVTARELERAHARLAEQQAAIAEIQRSLLPTRPPAIPGLDLSVHYRATDEAGGDYYDFFELSKGRTGFLIADVSGHGAPAAVIMAITHAIAHLHDGPAGDPSRMLHFLNEHLGRKYTGVGGVFVTALYGIYCPETCRFTFSLAGHPAPRVLRADAGTVIKPRASAALPLGVEPETVFRNTAVNLRPGDRMMLFTDGLTEARDGDGKLFGTDRVDQILARPGLDAAGVIAALRHALREYTGDRGVEDDLTLLVARVT